MTTRCIILAIGNKLCRSLHKNLDSSQFKNAKDSTIKRGHTAVDGKCLVDGEALLMHDRSLYHGGVWCTSMNLSNVGEGVDK